jgi:hypothetical protein
MPKSSTSPVWHANPSAAARRRNSATSRDLPIPGSPRTTIVLPAALSAQPRSAATSCASSARRPTKRLRVVARDGARELHESPRAHRHVDALGLDRVDRNATGDALGTGVRHVVEHRFPRAREVHQARGEIHRVSDHRVGAVLRAAEAARHHFAGGDADVHRQRLVGLGAKRGHGLVDLRRGPHRALRLVAMGDRRAEGRHDRVTDVLVDRAAVALDDFVDDAEIAAEQRVDVFRVVGARELRVARQIGEEDRHRPPVPVGRRAGGPALCAGRRRHGGLRAVRQRRVLRGTTAAAESLRRVVDEPAGRAGCRQRRPALRAKPPAGTIGRSAAQAYEVRHRSRPLPPEKSGRRG